MDSMAKDWKYYLISIFIFLINYLFQNYFLSVLQPSESISWAWGCYPLLSFFRGKMFFIDFGSDGFYFYISTMAVVIVEIFLIWYMQVAIGFSRKFSIALIGGGGLCDVVGRLKYGSVIDWMVCEKFGLGPVTFNFGDFAALLGLTMFLFHWLWKFFRGT